MRTNRRAPVALAGAILLAASGAHATDTDLQAELKEMRETIRALQDEIQAQDRRIEDQNSVLQGAGLAEQNQSMSALSSFLETTDFYGWVSATYNHDLTFESGNDGALPGGATPFGGTKPNTFGLNQLWFGMDKAPTEESRGGFHVDIAYGAIAPFSGGSTDTVEIYSAYASYLAPIGNGIQIDAGELWTLIGAEVVDTLGNFNITRGTVWSLQPVNHVGAIASTELADGFSVALGAVNDPFSDANFDSDNNKGVTGQIAFSGDSFYAGVSGIYGSQFDGPTGNEGDKYGLIDVLLTADPTDNVSLWANYNFNWFKDTPGAYGFAGEGDDSLAHAVALAGRVGITDRTGVALRWEGIFFDPDGIDNEEIYTLTGTVDHKLTDNLTARAEVRWDTSTFDGLAVDQDGSNEDDSVLGIIELVYAF